MNDIARYLGALYRQDDGASVNSIVYDGVTYTWDSSLGLKGSNWANNGTTLVSIVVAEYQTNSTTSYELTINDEIVTLNLVTE